MLFYSGVAMDVSDDTLRELCLAIPSMAGEEHTTKRYKYGRLATIVVELDGIRYKCYLDIIGDWEDWAIDKVQII